eukprot:11699469-Alexandrium_andersonii.AAC.1
MARGGAETAGSALLRRGLHGHAGPRRRLAAHAAPLGRGWSCGGVLQAAVVSCKRAVAPKE